jgi:hypothetical protein
LQTHPHLSKKATVMKSSRPVADSPSSKQKQNPRTSLTEARQTCYVTAILFPDWSKQAEARQEGKEFRSFFSDWSKQTEARQHLLHNLSSTEAARKGIQVFCRLRTEVRQTCCITAKKAYPHLSKAELKTRSRGAQHSNPMARTAHLTLHRKEYKRRVFSQFLFIHFCNGCSARDTRPQNN